MRIITPYDIYALWPQFADMLLRGVLLIEYLPHEKRCEGTYPAPH